MRSLKSEISKIKKINLFEKRISEWIKHKQSTLNDARNSYFPQVKRYALKSMLSTKDISKNIYASRTVEKMSRKTVGC